MPKCSLTSYQIANLFIELVLHHNLIIFDVVEAICIRLCMQRDREPVLITWNEIDTYFSNIRMVFQRKMKESRKNSISIATGFANSGIFFFFEIHARHLYYTDKNECLENAYVYARQRDAQRNLPIKFLRFVMWVLVLSWVLFCRYTDVLWRSGWVKFFFRLVGRSIGCV